MATAALVAPFAAADAEANGMAPASSLSFFGGTVKTSDPAVAHPKFRPFRAGDRHRPTNAESGDITVSVRIAA